MKSTVTACRQRDESPNCGVVAETMKLLANSSDGSQIMERRRHSVRRSMIDETTHAAINDKMFKRLRQLNDNLHGVEFAETEIEHKESIIIVFFILHNAKVRILHL